MGKIVGLDTSVFIYLLEDHPRYASRSEKILNAVQNGQHQAVFASVGLIEILTGPKKLGRYGIAYQYLNYITRFPHLKIIDLNESVIDKASDLRATYQIKTPDAIHIASALHAGAGVFITNDKRLQQIKEIKIQQL